MAVFAKNTLTQVSGFNNPIIAGELVWEQQTYWNLALSSEEVPVNLDGATIDAQIVRRTVSDLIDTRNGLTFIVTNYEPPPTPVELTITNRDDAAGTFTLVINDESWDLISDDPELNIAIENCVCFTGRIKISFPAVEPTPAEDNIIFLMFLVRSDGVVVV
tara:strand:+ start:153 stop:635 length:483 start_codon:yes stop_codon:yes gene_type:complete